MMKCPNFVKIKLPPILVRRCMVLQKINPI